MTGHRPGARWAGVAQVVAVIWLFGAGCSDPDVATTPIGKTYPVSGKVVLSNGKPLTAGRVVLVPDEPTGAPSSGDIKTDGQFRLTTKSPGDGAVPGRYKLRVEPGPSPDRKPKKPPFPAKYLDEDSSHIVVTVKGEPNTLDPIRLK